MTPRLKTHIQVSGLIRRAQSAGAFAAIIRKGDPDAGAYLICARQGREVSVFTSERNMDGEIVWIETGPLDDDAARDFINRRVDFDPDLWVVEIEDAKGRNFLDETKPAAPSESKAAAEALFQAPKPRR